MNTYFPLLFGFVVAVPMAEGGEGVYDGQAMLCLCSVVDARHTPKFFVYVGCMRGLQAGRMSLE